VAKRSGGLRLVEAPKARLKALQTRILRDILDKIPPHPQTHGFVRSRSIKTFALPHTGKQAVLRIDLRDFFPSFKAARVQTLFRVLGYPETVADILGGICTTTAPRGVWAKIEGADRREIREAFELYRLVTCPRVRQLRLLWPIFVVIARTADCPLWQELQELNIPAMRTILPSQGEKDLREA
jgi:hypothetical protein